MTPAHRAVLDLLTHYVEGCRRVGRNPSPRRLRAFDAALDAVHQDAKRRAAAVELLWEAA